MPLQHRQPVHADQQQGRPHTMRLNSIGPADFKVTVPRPTRPKFGDGTAEIRRRGKTGCGETRDVEKQ